MLLLHLLLDLLSSWYSTIVQDDTRGSRKMNIDRLLTAGALPRNAPHARAPSSLQTTPRHFQLQARQSPRTHSKTAAAAEDSLSVLYTVQEAVLTEHLQSSYKIHRPVHWPL